MSYTFKPDCYYRMPTHFGPSLGPRQGIDGGVMPTLKLQKISLWKPSLRQSLLNWKP